MASAGKGGRYHHGDLRAALIDTAIELIGERGVRGFSLAEASRRLGVAASAPYAHFADRDQLLAAVTARAWEHLAAELQPAIDALQAPAERLAALAHGYVRFAATNPALVKVLYEVGLDKGSYPEIEAAEKPVAGAVLACVRALTGGSDQQADDLATAVEATARGFALLLLDGDFGTDAHAVERAAEQAARATAALIEGRHLLAPAQPGDPHGTGSASGRPS
jgi:AcrR family transcriptional regulator